MPIDVTVIDIDDEQIDTLFGEAAPASTFKADDLEPAKKKETPTKTEKPNSDTEEDNTPEVTEIQEEDEEGLFAEQEVEVVETKKATKEDKAKEAQTLNFKNLVDHLVESGKWAEFDGREDIEEINEEDFYKLTEAQDEHRVTSKFNDVLDRTGDYGKAIIQFEKDGGNPTELLQLFREQRDIQNVDLSVQDNQEEVIRAYYEAQDEDEAWINDYIDSLKDRGDEAFKRDAEKKHSKLLENNKAEVAQTLAQQAENKKVQEEAQKSFQTNIRKTIHSVEDWSNSEKKDLEKFLLSYDKKLQDGRVVNGLFVKMLEIQQDPNKYTKFAKFIQDMDKYEETIKKKASKETTKSTWKIIKDSEGEGFKKASIMPDEVKSKRIDPFSLTFKS